MSDVLLGILAAALLAGTALLIATAARIPSLPQLVLAAYVVAFAEIVGLALALSAFEAVTRRAILLGLAGVLAAAVLVWLGAGAPRPPHVPSRIRCSELRPSCSYSPWEQGSRSATSGP